MCAAATGGTHDVRSPHRPHGRCNPVRRRHRARAAAGALLAAEHGGADVVRRRKLSITDPVPADTLAELVAACDVVVVGVGDCGSCSASAVADGLALEAAGVPAVVIC